MQMLSRHFSLDEFTFSSTAARKDIDNTPNAIQQANLTLVAQTLEQVRWQASCPIIITSGFRNPKVNKLVGGSPTSDHMDGRAADIKSVKHTPRELANLIIGAGIKFEQLILEFERWVHISVPPSARPAKMEVLTAKKINGKTVYLRGIV